MVKLRHALGTAIDCGEYRKNDLERLVTRVGQIEDMLPMQTRIIRLPYENLLGGFPLFQQVVSPRAAAAGIRRRRRPRR